MGRREEQGELGEQRNRVSWEERNTVSLGGEEQGELRGESDRVGWENRGIG